MSAHPLPTATFEFIQPEVAELYLGKNMANRNRDYKRVGQMAADMANGDWMVTHAGIAFDWNGELVDGQHRLAAIVKSGEPQYMLVSRGLDPEVRHVIDTGRPRTAGNSLNVAGYPDATILGGMAKVVALWDEGALRLSVQFLPPVSNREVVAWVSRNADTATEFCRLARRIRKAGFPTPSVSTLAAALFILSRVDADDAAALADRMYNRTLYGNGDPLFVLDRRISAASRDRETLRTAGLISMYFRTWNALREGKRVTQLKVGSAGAGGVITIPQPK